MRELFLSLFLIVGIVILAVCFLVFSKKEELERNDKIFICVGTLIEIAILILMVIV